ncbi:Failed axon connections [Chionoecetes opilio]|uniref:Failed axon connections n=1 Tax=Chionoecetes opilio TaxID=41210 RepID=A0A8J4XNV0_CHIOP|nr:Failed axon connections [Chionoecetes opilio]
MQFLGEQRWPLAVGVKGIAWLWKRSRRVAVAAVVVVTVVKVHGYIAKQQRRKRWENAGKDVAVVHMFPRGRKLPNLSPFVLKLETYLRMADIKYEVDFEEPLGAKNKAPWITLNGEELTDSQLIVEHLASKFEKDFSSHLTREERATAHALRTMLEDHTLWVLVYERYVEKRGKALLRGMHVPCYLRMAVNMFVRRIKKVCWLQGMGRHSPTEIQHMGKQDLSALSDYLGDKDFLMGDKATEVDCTLFGFLCQLMWADVGSPYVKMLETEFPNLRAYTLRVRDKFWPDWNACLDPPQPVQ